MEGPATVLVADDQASSREQMTRVLREAGYRVVVAFDGDQALRKCRRERPDVAVLDVIMPNQDGLEVCTALRADSDLPYIPILFVSARATPEDRVRGLRVGADGYLAKPCHDEELLAHVEALLRIRRLIVPDAPAEPADAEVLSNIGRDRLTGLWSPAYLDERLDTELQRASRHNEPLSLMVIDVGRPSALAAAHGQATADRTLLAAAEAIGRCTRAIDVLSRCTEPAFAVILPNTHFAGAIATADRLWHELAAARITADDHSEPQPIDYTIGVACYPNPKVKGGNDLLEYARSALARAHQEGPAHICLYQHQAYIFQPE